MVKNDLYLELIKKALTNYLYLGKGKPFDHFRITSEYYTDFHWKIPELSRPQTLLAPQQLNALQHFMLITMITGTPGDFIEAGVYKGGAVIFMRAVLKACGITDRIVWVADSFEGIPFANKYTGVEDEVNDWPDRWCAGLEEVKGNFERYGLLDDQVRFLKGFFADTLPKAPFNNFAVVRLDGDSYESTMDALEYLYPRISVGGYIIIDDWGLKGCRQAVEEYRQIHQIEEEIKYIVGARGSPHESVGFEAFWEIGKFPTAANCRVSEEENL